VHKKQHTDLYSVLHWPDISDHWKGFPLGSRLKYPTGNLWP